MADPRAAQNRSVRRGPEPGARVRARAAEAVAAVLTSGRRLEDALRYDGLDRADRALMRELATGTVRWARRLRAVADGLLDRGLPAGEGYLEALLLVGLYQTAHTRIPPHAAVSATVSATPVKKAWARRLLNGVLRRFEREADAHLARADALGPGVRTAHPDWLVDALRSAYPEEWSAVLDANNRPAPMTLRVAGDAGAYGAELGDRGMAWEPVAGIPGAVRLAEAQPVGALPGFPEGRVSVQDAAAQLAAPLLDARPGQRVLDACSAPGGKLAHILERTPGARVVGVEADAERLERVRETVERTGVRPEALIHGDATRPEEWWDGEPFDRILVDAPCSGTGVVRRHPDIKHLRRPEDLSAMQERQSALLAALWPLLGPGGCLVYATCSVLPGENGERIDGFLAEGDGARVDTPALPHGRARGAGWQILPGEGGLDGFFYARLRREAA